MGEVHKIFSFFWQVCIVNDTQNAGIFFFFAGSNASMQRGGAVKTVGFCRGGGGKFYLPFNTYLYLYRDFNPITHSLKQFGPIG